jgi:hypothetical protein
MRRNPHVRVTLTAALFIGGLVFLFLPSELWLRNPTEFVSAPAPVAGLLALWWVFASAVLFLPVLAPWAGWRRAWSALVGGLAFALWASAVFLVPELGAMDGAGFDLGMHRETLVRHSYVFVAVLLVSWLVAWLWLRYLNWGLVILAAGLFLTTASNFHAVGKLREKPFETVDPWELSRFSGETNLLILVLDTFQSDLLQVLTERDPSLREQLDGFVFYPDTLGVAPSTYLTMPAFHSGRPYNRLMSLNEFYEYGVKQNSFLTDLAEDGYQVDIVNPIASVCPKGVNTCKYQENLLFVAKDAAMQEALRLSDLAVLRAAPGLSKAFVFDGSTGLVTWLSNGNYLTGLEHRIFMGNRVLQAMIDHLRVDDGPPTARLIHLLNTHPPFMFDAQCEFIGVQKPINRKLQTEQTACAMRWVLRLLTALREAGVYDNSMVVLTADTGAGNIYADDDLSSLYAQRNGLPPGETGRLLGGANPVLAIKFPGSRGPLRASTLQAQLTDLPRTVCDTLGDCSTARGINLRTDDPGTRARTYHYYEWRHAYWGLDTIPGIVQYTVRGPLWLEDSWSEFASGDEVEQVLGLTFSHGDDPGLFGPGWGDVEVASESVSKRWVTEEQASLYLPLNDLGDLYLKFRVLPAAALVDTHMSVRLNGTPLETLVLEEGLQDLLVTLPVALLQPERNEIEFEFSQLKSPQGAESRSLAAAFYELSVYR